MKNKRKYKSTFGTFALAQFWIVLVSGLLLMIPFSVNEAYLSISKMMLSNPWASFLRNTHYWSSQFFLVLSLVHLYDHYHKKKKIGLKKGIGLRLSAGVLIIFLAMITGFLLKADADAEQARQILESLALAVPFIGKSLAFSLLGQPDNYLIIYLHHCATLTVFIAYIIIEHGKIVWPKSKEFILSFVAVFVFSFLFSAPLHDNINPSVKGPWYFVGFQEILHWMSRPAWSILLFIIIVLLIYLVNSAKKKIHFVSKRFLLVFTGFYLVVTIIGLFFRGEQWKWLWPGDTAYTYSVLYNFKTPPIDVFPEYKFEEVNQSAEILGRKESCLICHTKTYGFVEAHNPDIIGCSSCHGGNPNTGIKKKAHKNMLLIPGNLATSNQSCGTTNCHSDIVERVPTSLMATLSGMISVNRTVFGEQSDLDILTHVDELGHSAADEHLKNLCVKCHLGNPKTEYGPAKEWTRGGGCLACHLNYSEKAERALKNSKSGYVRAHPEVSLKVTNNHCFGCHNRSGRIATNYEGWHETTLKTSDVGRSEKYRFVEGRRVFEKQPADIHHDLGMECIDCHHSYELMGDGNLYAHQEEQQDVQCADCHFSGNPSTIKAENLDYESSLIAALRFSDISKKEYLVTQKQSRALINTYFENDTAFMISKNSGRKFILSSPAKICEKNNAHSTLTCSSCHTAWASSCIGCHNTYDENAKGYNMLTGDEIIGTWKEKHGTFEAKLPALGVRKTENGEEVVPVIPGMVLTIDKESFTGLEEDSTIFHRLFAPVAPHTTSKKGRACKSCHNNPVALGYGEGNLTYEIRGQVGIWRFRPKYGTREEDDLPEDAWIGFMEFRTDMASTRKNVFPLSVDQQKRMLKIGACLTCHDENSKQMLNTLDDYQKQLNTLSDNCILPKNF